MVSKRKVGPPRLSVARIGSQSNVFVAVVSPVHASLKTDGHVMTAVGNIGTGTGANVHVLGVGVGIPGRAGTGIQTDGNILAHVGLGTVAHRDRIATGCQCSLANGDPTIATATGAKANANGADAGRGVVSHGHRIIVVHHSRVANGDRVVGRGGQRIRVRLGLC